MKSGASTYWICQITKFQKPRALDTFGRKCSGRQFLKTFLVHTNEEKKLSIKNN